jgi:hypothetical protein
LHLSRIFSEPRLSDYNIGRAFCVCRNRMAKLFRVKARLNQGSVLCFVNRSTESGRYALEEGFSREEATSLERLLKSRNLECRIREIPAGIAADRLASWNIIGPLVELAPGDTDQLPFHVVGCLVL